MNHWKIYLTEIEMNDIKKGEIISKYLSEGVLDIELWVVDNPENHAPDKVGGESSDERGQARAGSEGGESAEL